MDNILKAYFIWVAASLFLLLALFSCGGPRNLYREYYTCRPQYIIDSLYREHQLNTLKSYTEWGSVQFYGNDSVKTNIYTEAFQKADSLFIISVTEKENKDTVLLRFRREIHK